MMRLRYSKQMRDGAAHALSSQTRHSGLSSGWPAPQRSAACGQLSTVPTQVLAFLDPDHITLALKYPTGLQKPCIDPRRRNRQIGYRESLIHLLHTFQHRTVDLTLAMRACGPPSMTVAFSVEKHGPQALAITRPKYNGSCLDCMSAVADYVSVYGCNRSHYTTMWSFERQNDVEGDLRVTATIHMNQVIVPTIQSVYVHIT